MLQSQCHREIRPCSLENDGAETGRKKRPLQRHDLEVGEHAELDAAEILLYLFWAVYFDAIPRPRRCQTQHTRQTNHAQNEKYMTRKVNE